MFYEHPFGGGGSAIVGAPTCTVAGEWVERARRRGGQFDARTLVAVYPPYLWPQARRGAVAARYYGDATRYSGVVGPRQYLIAQTSELTTKSRIASRFSPSAG